MSDAQYVGAWITGLLTLWLLATLTAIALAKAAGRTRPPMPRQEDRRG